jgi:type II secretory pathway component PulJ
MLALALALLFTATGFAAVLVILDSVMKGRTAWARLAREAALMRAGYALQVDARQLRMRPATRRAMPDRRPALLRSQPAPLCAAA